MAAPAPSASGLRDPSAGDDSGTSGKLTIALVVVSIALIMLFGLVTALIIWRDKLCFDFREKERKGRQRGAFTSLWQSEPRDRSKFTELPRPAVYPAGTFSTPIHKAFTRKLSSHLKKLSEASNRSVTVNTPRPSPGIGQSEPAFFQPRPASPALSTETETLTPRALSPPPAAMTRAGRFGSRSDGRRDSGMSESVSERGPRATTAGAPSESVKSLSPTDLLSPRTEA